MCEHFCSRDSQVRSSGKTKLWSEDLLGSAFLVTLGGVVPIFLSLFLVPPLHAQERTTVKTEFRVSYHALRFQGLG